MSEGNSPYSFSVLILKIINKYFFIRICFKLDTRDPCSSKDPRDV